MLSDLLALEEIHVAPRRREELTLRGVDLEGLMRRGLVKEEGGLLYLTEAGVRELSSLYGLMDFLQVLYMDLAYGRKRGADEVDGDTLRELVESGLAEVREGSVELTFEGIKLAAQRITDKMSRAH